MKKQMKKKETNTLHVDDEPQGVDVTSFLYN